MIFVTVGSRSFPFDRLLRAVDACAGTGEFARQFFAQTGSGGYKPVNFPFAEFLDQDEFARKIECSDLVITHGGTGAIIGALKKGKKVIAVPRLSRFGEAVDDHQIQLIRQFETMGLIIACYDCDGIGQAVREAGHFRPRPYLSNTRRIIESIEEFITECRNEGVSLPERKQDGETEKNHGTDTV